ncbi:splicing factor 3A subunit 1 [Pseudohyphozyma bogoriensis]|nr:splicing factor 3A subunit 1 [Pseudohyphozyma bogoriensis]
MNLPPPTNGNGNGDESPLAPASAAAAADKYEGIVLPPPEIRQIVDKTASFVAKNANPAVFEEKIRAREKSDSRFAFLNTTDAYYPYYQSRLESFRAGEVLENKDAAASAAAAGAKDAVQQGLEEVKADVGPPKPPTLDFVVEDPPSINAVDLDILRLTALFTARSGRRFMQDLANREARNYQFDFLRPSHSLFGYFNRLTEQYTKILIPSKDYLANLDRRAGGPSSEPADEKLAQAKREVLKDAKVRAEWEKWESSKKKEAEDAAEAERIAFAEIDWQDFVVVSTVEFTEQDEAGLVELPPPMSLSEVENMTIAQKKMASMIMEGREDEIVEDERERERGEEAEMDMDDDDEDDEDRRAKEAEKERLKAVEIVQATANGPMKIRKDYVPKAKREKVVEQATTMFNGQQVPVEEFADHVRIELLDPKWKETKRQNEINRSAANLLPGGTDVSASLRALASHRADIFGTADDAEIKRQQEEAKLLSKAREAGVWDGHTATKEGITARYQAAANLDEQIEALHRTKGLLAVDEDETRIGPAAPAVAPVVEQQPPSTFLNAGAGATISAAPQPNQQSNPYSTGQYGQGYGQAQYGQPTSGTGYPPASAPGLPARPAVANPGEAMPAAAVAPVAEGVASPYAGGRPAEDEPEDAPSSKRQKLADGQYYPEEEWVASHPEPISIKVQLPDYPAKPEWGCNGSEITLTEVPITALCGALRDRITAKVGLPIGKQKLTYKGRILANNGTLAGLNFEDGDEVVVTIKERK